MRQGKKLDTLYFQLSTLDILLIISKFATTCHLTLIRVLVDYSRWLICDQDNTSLWCIESYGIQGNVGIPPRRSHPTEATVKKQKEAV